MIKILPMNSISARFVVVARFQNRRTKWKKQNPGLDVNASISTSPSSMEFHSAATAAAAAYLASFYNSSQTYANSSSSSSSSSLISSFYTPSFYQHLRKFT
jgi:hypothetical protein